MWLERDTGENMTEKVTAVYTCEKRDREGVLRMAEKMEMTGRRPVGRPKKIWRGTSQVQLQEQTRRSRRPVKRLKEFSEFSTSQRSDSKAFPRIPGLNFCYPHN